MCPLPEVAQELQCSFITAFTGKLGIVTEDNNWKARNTRFGREHSRQILQCSLMNICSTTAYRHVFPGNHTPVVLHELLAAANASSFEAVEVHNDRHSYFLTLAEWARRLESARAELVASYGQRTFRLFQLYLWATAHAMAVGTLESYRVVIQRAVGSRSSEVGLAAG